MSVAFPQNKDLILDELEDDNGLSLSDEEYARLRKIPAADLFLLQKLFARAKRYWQEQADSG